jgi:Nodulin-like
MQVRLRAKGAARDSTTAIATDTSSSHHSEDVDRPHEPLNNNNNNEDNSHNNDLQSQGESSYMSAFRPSHNIPQLTCAFLASLTTGGTTYAFGLYGDALKKSLRLTQPQLDTISTANFCAGLFSWVPGLIVDRMGVKTGLVSGGIQGAVSLSLYWGVATEFFPVERWMLVPTLSALGVTIFLSCALITGSVFKIIVSTCGPGSKGTAVGAAKGYVGLGAGVYASLFESLRSPTQSDLDFLPMAGFFFIACVTIPSMVMMPNHDMIRNTTFEDESTPNHFRALYVSLMAMACLIIAQSLQELMGYNDARKKQNPEDTGPNFLLAIFLVVVWLGPIYGLQWWPKKSTLPPPEPTEIEEQEGESLLQDVMEDRRESSGDISLQRMHLGEDHVENHDDFLRIPGSDADVVESGLTLNTINLNQPQEVEEEFDNNKNLWQMLQTPTAWLMLWTTTILVGGGIVETNNMGQVRPCIHVDLVVFICLL